MRNTQPWAVEDNFLLPAGSKTKTWRQFTIVRGLPSSGKSTHGAVMERCADYAWIEADHMFRASNGSYKIVPAQIKAAHEAARNSLILALGCRSNIVVTNTATRLWELDSYLSVIGTHSPDCRWKIKIVDLQEGVCHLPSLKVNTIKYLEMALRYESIPADFLVRWVAHFNATRSNRRAYYNFSEPVTDESTTGSSESTLGNGGDPLFKRRILIDHLQYARINQCMTEAQFNNFIAGLTNGKYTSYQDLHQDKEVADMVIAALRARPPAIMIPFSQIEDMMAERNVSPDIRHAVKSVWNRRVS